MCGGSRPEPWVSRQPQHDLERWPAERALVYNLTNPAYVETVYADLAAAPKRFAEAFEHRAWVRAAAQPEEATVRLNPRQRKGNALLDHVSTVRQVIAHA